VKREKGAERGPLPGINLLKVSKGERLDTWPTVKRVEERLSGASLGSTLVGIYLSYPPLGGTLVGIYPSPLPLWKAPWWV